MPEPTAAAASTAVIAGAAVVPMLHEAAHFVPQIVINGFALGLRADVLLAGFAGSVAALAFFNAVPATGDTLGQLARTTLRRMWFCLASSLTAGYIAPLVLLLEGERLRIPDSLLVCAGFLVGVTAQRYLGKLKRKLLGAETTEDKANAAN